MVSTFINPVVNPDQPLGLSAFTETAPIRHWPAQSADEAESMVNAIYKQILSNAYVMESERQQVCESQFKQGEISVIEFIRRVAKSDLYRTRFFENGPRNRFIELNFKHFLGRAPENLAEVAAHSAILDSEGYEAEIDSYLDSDEYTQAFGESVVPYYRGYKTEGSTPAGFTHMLSLLRGASSSDKQVAQNNPARLTKTLFADKASAVFSPSGATNRQGVGKNLNVDELLRSVFSQSAQKAASSSSQPSSSASADARADATKSTGSNLTGKETGKEKSQAEQIEQLTQQLNELRSLSNMGAAILRKGQRPASARAEASFGSGVASTGSSSQSSAQTNTQTNAQKIEQLQGELMAARSLGAIAQSKLNKWRSRSY